MFAIEKILKKIYNKSWFKVIPPWTESLIKASTLHIIRPFLIPTRKGLFADNKNIDELAYYLDSGADDYIAGQFDIRVMYARIEKLLREYDKTEEEQTIVFHDMFLQPKLKEYFCSAKDIGYILKE